MQPLNHPPAVAVRRTERGDHPDGAWDCFIGAFDIADPLLAALNTMANVVAGQQAWFADPVPGLQSARLEVATESRRLDGDYQS